MICIKMCCRVYKWHFEPKVFIRNSTILFEMDEKSSATKCLNTLFNKLSYIFYFQN